MRNNITPLMKQYNDIKKKYPDSILLFRMGDFYETFNEDAVKTSEIIGIVLTKRAHGQSSEVKLAGFPYHSLDIYLPQLVAAGNKVAICEQIENASDVKGIVKRKVMEVITPGSITLDNTLRNKINKYMATIFKEQNKTGYCIFEPSTGQFLIGECSDKELTNNLNKYCPDEIIINKKTVYSLEDWFLKLRPYVTQIENYKFSFENSYRELTNHMSVKTLKGFGVEDFKLGIVAAGTLLYYLKNTLNNNTKHITKIEPILSDEYMNMDISTIKNLEIFNSLSSNGAHGTLINSIDFTSTPSGSRLLRHWLFHPQKNISIINERLEVVSYFKNDKALLENLRIDLNQTCDIERILGKINRGKVNPKDVLALGMTLITFEKWTKTLSLIKNKSIKNIISNYHNLNKISSQIVKVININCSPNIKSGNIINKNISKNLDEFKTILNDGKKWIDNFEQTEINRLSISSLKVGFNKIFGYYIDITKSNQDKVPTNYIRKQTLVNSERYITKELKIYEQKVLEAEIEVQNIEYEIFTDLINSITNCFLEIKENTFLFNNIDLLSSFSYLAIIKNYVKPEIVSDSFIKLTDSRHPVVEDLLPSTDNFIPNNLILDTNSQQIQLITGPNMAGKSTYLRQIGIIVILAQIGCYIPAKYGKIGIVDRLFTRVGASDNLAGGESTFLVEMNEAANILNNATPKSLVLLDEIGRGTSTYDGLSIATAITEYIHDNKLIRSRTIFATHYHELTTLSEKLKRLINYHIQVDEYEDKIVFLRKITKGTGDKSYGIQVGKMAGLPDEVINRAKEILLSYDSNDNNIMITKNKIIKHKDNTYDALKEFINEIDINNLTPIAALQKLDDIKKKINL